MSKRYLSIFFFIFISLVVFNQTHNLNYYIKAGIENSPLLRDYNNQINSALVDSLLIRASKMPQVEAKSQLLYAPAYKNFGYDEVVTDGGNYTGVVGVTQSILNRKEINNKYNSVNLQRQTAVNATRISVAELRKMITGQYLAAFSDFNELTFNKSFLALTNKESEIVHQFVLQGLCKQTDYLTLQLEIQSQEILISQISSQYLKDLKQLNQLCGLRDTGLFELILPGLVVEGSPDINKSPFFLQYKLDSLRIENEKTAIDVKYLLKMNWFADAGFLTSTPWNFYTHFGYSAGISLNIPIYDGHQKNHEKQKLFLAENTRSAYQTNFRNQYSQQIEQLFDELISLRKLSTQLEKQLSTSEQLAGALRGQLEAGIIQMTEYINAIRNLRNINKSLSDNQIRIQQVINELNYLLVQ
jgi:outer membrane protein TolC